MQRRTRLIAAALAATTALGLIPSPASAANPPAQLHTFGPGGQLNSSEQFAPPGATPVIGTFDTEVGEDIIWYTPGPGGDAFWSSNQDGTWTASALSVSGTYTPYVGRFGGEDKADDILWYSTTGASQLWDYEVDAGVALIKTNLPTVTGTGTILVGDFTTDGTPDIVRYRPGAQPEQWWDFDTPGDGAAPTITNRSFSVNSTYTPIVGAFHTDTGQGDYGADILWYAPGAAADSLWDFNTDGSHGATALAVNGTFVPIVERWSGNQADDILWYAPGPAADSLWDFGPSHSLQTTPQTINGTYTPYTCRCVDSGLGDRDDIVWHGPGNAADAVWSFNGTTFAHTSYSYPGTRIRGAKLAVYSTDSVYETVISYG
ncbi:MAG TPA: hypothetical protein VGO60_00520 [Iamia sp.]|jgi:hypothetical protein|nr:hypothetical protein [Iamia sp.]